MSRASYVACDIRTHRNAFLCVQELSRYRQGNWMNFIRNAATCRGEKYSQSGLEAGVDCGEYASDLAGKDG